MDTVNPDNNLSLSSKEKLQGFFATRDYVKSRVEAIKARVEAVKALVERAKSDLVRWFFFVLLAIMGFVWYLHNDTKQALREAKQERQEIRRQIQADKSEAKQERAEARRERQELKQQISELKALIESLHGVNKSKPTLPK